jgi:hypothetical protein
MNKARTLHKMARKFHEHDTKNNTDMNIPRPLCKTTHENDTKAENCTNNTLTWTWHENYRMTRKLFENDTQMTPHVTQLCKLHENCRTWHEKRIDTNMALKFHTQNSNMIRTWSLVCHVLVICVSLLCNVLDVCAFVIFVQCSSDVLCYFGVRLMSFLCVILDAGLPIPCCSQCYLPGRITATADHRELPCS